MIRVNPRQASLRAPEIASFQILTPLGAGRGRAGAQSTPGQVKAAEDQGGLQPVVPPLPGGHSQRKGCSPRGEPLPHPTPLSPGCQGVTRYNGTSPSALLSPSLLRSVHLQPTPQASPVLSFCLPTLQPQSCPTQPPQPLVTLLTCGRSWLCPGHCCRDPELHQPCPHPHPRLREQPMQAGKGTAHTSNKIRAAIGARSC